MRLLLPLRLLGLLRWWLIRDNVAQVVLDEKWESCRFHKEGHFIDNWVEGEERISSQQVVSFRNG